MNVLRNWYRTRAASIPASVRHELRHPRLGTHAGFETRAGSAVAIEAYPESEAREHSAPRAQSRRDHTRAIGETWVIVLAGGEGRRISSFTTSEDGIAVPKQFCRFRDERTLLTATVDRALRVTSPERVLVLVQEAHRRWWESELDRLPASNILSQSENHGTAIAILQALVEIHCRDRNPRLVVMPSDTDVDDETVLLEAISLAQRTAWAYPEDVILLGVVPSHIDCEYGLIVPAGGRSATGRRVRSFVEKPPITLARLLTRAGAMWNSFIFACNGWALYDVFEEALPAVAAAYLRSLKFLSGGIDPRGLSLAAMPECDFGRDVLQRSTGRLRLVPVPQCGWTDLGTPARLASWLDRHREAIFWRDHPPSRLANGEAH